MSNARKLQTEIDRVMKKVDEGVELFDEIWEKVYSAEQQNQKEKYEMDLKKEIKKLQRLRDQIKTWIGSSDVKDKEPLMEARRLIETKMEQFKICEKETKTKTYSKEGLARAEKLDPVEEAKQNTTQWIQEYIEKLQEVVEEVDFEIERLSSGKGKKSNKHQIEQLQQHIMNHRFHISKLEGIIRLVNNDRLDVEPVDQLKEDLDYYIDSYADEDYMQAYDADYFYESLGLDELDVVNVDHVTQAVVQVKKVDGDAASMSSKGSSKDTRRSSKKSGLASVIPLTIGRARASSKAERKAAELEEAKLTPSKVSRSSSTASSTSNGGGGASSGSNRQPPTAPAAVAPPAATATPPAVPHAGGASMAAILKRETEQQEKERQKILREQQTRAQAEQMRQQQQAQETLKRQQAQQQEALRQQQQEAQQAQQQQQAAAQEALKRQQAQQQEALRQQQVQQEAAAKAAQIQAAQQKAAAAAQEEKAQQKLQQSQQVPPTQGGGGQQTNALDILASGLGGLGISGEGTRNDPSAVPIGGGVSVASSSNSQAAAAAAGTAAPSGAALQNAGASYMSALGESFATTPNAVDNDRNRQYTPQNPYPTPASYPSTPSAIFENPAIFEKLGTDCLFFIFYYAQGTYQQYLAARELKKQSWRFHKKYMTWFQRHEEPKITTDEYEQGTYVYFDYETGWCTRIKTDFRFEYSFLEDSLQ